MPCADKFLTTLTNEPKLMQTYGKELINTVTRRIINSLKDNQILNGRSSASYADLKIVSFDLKNLVKMGTTDEDMKKASLMYMLTIAVGTELWFLDDDSIHLFDDLYTSYGEKLIEEVFNDPKRLDVDEYWKTGNRVNFRKFIEMLVRTGPKYKISTHLATHKIQDVCVLSSLVGILVIMGQPEEGEMQTLQENINLPNSVVNLLSSKSFGQKKGECLIMVQTNTEKHWQHVQLNISKQELWSNSTTNSDTSFRQRLKKSFPQDYLNILSDYFPAGNIQDELEEIEDEMNLTDLTTFSKELNLQLDEIDASSILIARTKRRVYETNRNMQALN